MKATKMQIRYINHISNTLGLKIKTSNLTKSEANEIISENMENYQDELAYIEFYDCFRSKE